ncbi:hypothetical protein [Clostridium sardiniense]|uniref:hypothetical protein n=1 Tax=Clostridium sardiniense TaxID=29369 RepID=UPI003D348E3F
MKDKKKKINSTKCNCKISKEPNDGNFIERDPRDSFSAEGTVRYGEETDVDDI